MAQFLANCADPKFRKPAEALKLAQAIVRQAPKNATGWNALGLACYRTGDSQGAITALEKSIQLSEGGEVLDGFFLAMANRRLRNPQEARRWYDESLQRL